MSDTWSQMVAAAGAEELLIGGAIGCVLLLGIAVVARVVGWVVGVNDD